MLMKTKAKYHPLGEDARQAAAAKMARLRALRLAKEAGEKTASGINAGNSRKQRSRS
jgi:hypothetical protein